MKRRLALTARQLLSCTFFTIIMTILAMFPGNAAATMISLEAMLNPANELHTVTSAGSSAGSADMIFDTDTNMFSWNILFSGLSTGVTGVHTHGPATTSSAAGVQVNLGAISGLTSPMIGSTIIDNGQAADLLNELWYINVHTMENPAGEIRGQITVAPVPEPSTLLLLGAGLASLAVYRRKTKK